MVEKAGQYAFSLNRGNKFVCEKDSISVIAPSQVVENVETNPLPLAGQFVFINSFRVGYREPTIGIPKLKNGTDAPHMLNEDRKVVINPHLAEEMWGISWRSYAENSLYDRPPLSPAS